MVVEWVGGGWYRDILSIRKLHFLKLNTHLNRDFLIFKKARYSFTGIFDDLAHFIRYRYISTGHRTSSFAYIN